MQRVLVSAGTYFGERKLDWRKENDDKDGNCPQHAQLQRRQTEGEKVYSLSIFTILHPPS